MKVYNLGALNIDYVYTVDHIIAEAETMVAKGMEVFPGGKSLNQSVALTKAGVKVIHGAVIGDEGELLIQALSGAGIDTGRIEKRVGSCGHTIIQVDKYGENSIIIFPGTNHAIDADYIERFLCDAEEGDLLLLQNEISHLEIAFEIAHAKKMQIVFNPSPYHDEIKELPLSYVTWWFCNELEGEGLFNSADPKEIANNFVKAFPHSNLILTLGEEGSVFANADTYLEQPIYKVHTVDTTAAGDTYTGYFVAALISGKDVAFALDIAAKASSIAVSRKGASPSIPSMEEVYGK